MQASEANKELLDSIADILPQKYPDRWVLALNTPSIASRRFLLSLSKGYKDFGQCQFLRAVMPQNSRSLSRSVLNWLLKCGALYARFKKEGNTIHNLALNESYQLDDPNMNPLEIASLLVQVNWHHFLQCKLSLISRAGSEYAQESSNQQGRIGIISQEPE